MPAAPAVVRRRGRASRCGCTASTVPSADLAARAPGRRRAAAAGRSGRGRRTCGCTCAPPNERLSSRPPYSRANGTPWATHWSMMSTDTCGEAVHVGLAGAEVAALHRVVEEAVDAVAVVLVVLGGVDAALRGDRVGPPGRVVEREDLHLVAELAERGRGRRAGQAGADDDDLELALVGRVHELDVELVLVPLLARSGPSGILASSVIGHRWSAHDARPSARRRRRARRSGRRRCRRRSTAAKPAAKSRRHLLNRGLFQPRHWNRLQAPWKRWTPGRCWRRCR